MHDDVGSSMHIGRVMKKRLVKHVSSSMHVGSAMHAHEVDTIQLLQHASFCRYE
jgi:hypothetical protein